MYPLSHYINRYGNYGFGGANPELLSNAIQRQFYSNSGSAIVGTAYPFIPGACYRYDYFASVGDVTDDFTGRTINNNIINYNFQKNEYLNWSLADKPTASFPALDVNENYNFYFGDASGQCYQFDDSFTDNGESIPTEMVFVYHFDSPQFQKAWRYWRGFFNPGCEANVQVATSDSYTYQTLKWKDLGDCTYSMHPVVYARRD